MKKRLNPRVVAIAAILFAIPASFNACLVTDVASEISGADKKQGAQTSQQQQQPMDVGADNSDPFSPKAGQSVLLDGSFAKGLERDDEDPLNPFIVSPDFPPQRIVIYDDFESRVLEADNSIHSSLVAFLDEPTIIDFAQFCESGSSGTERSQPVRIDLPNGDVVLGHFLHAEGTCIVEGFEETPACFKLLAQEFEQGATLPEVSLIDPTNAHFEFFFETQPGGCDNMAELLTITQPQ